MPETPTTPKKGGNDRKTRLAEELRANLLKRKAQARSRRSGLADQRPEGLEAATAGQRDEKQTE
jgi:hypothetical protein